MEKRIEEILRISPELIDPSFAGFKVKSQLIRGVSRLDLMVKTKRGSIIVEIKQTVLAVKHVEQLLGYCRKWALSREHFIRKDAYLVGFRPMDELPLLAAASKSKFNLKLRYIGEDVPRLVQTKNGGGYEPWEEGIGARPIKLF